MTVVGYVGAFLFGLVIGWVTSRLLARRSGSPHVSHVAAAVAAVGGGYVAVKSGSPGVLGLFGIAFFIGFLGYAAVFHRLNNDRRKTATLLGVDSVD